MAGKDWGVLTLKMQGQDAGLSSTMNRAGKATQKFTGKLDGLNNTYSNLSSKLGLVGAAMTLTAKASTGLVQSFQLLSKEGDEFTDATFKFQELLTTLPLGLGEAARATFEFGDAIGLTSKRSWEELKRVEQKVKDIRDELQETNKGIWEEARDIGERAKWTERGLSDERQAEIRRIRDLREMAGETGISAWERGHARLEAERERIQKELMESGMSWGDAYDEAEGQVNAVRTSIMTLEENKTRLAKAQLKRERDQAARDTARWKEESIFETFQSQVKGKLEKRLGEGAAKDVAELSLDKAQTKQAIERLYREAAKIAQEEARRKALADKLGVSVKDLVQELTPRQLRGMMVRENIGTKRMSELDRRAATDFGRMMIAAEHLAKMEGDRLAQEKESLALKEQTAKAQKLEAEHTKKLTKLTRERTAAQRELIQVNRMALGDQFTFQGFLGTIRIADHSDTARLQAQHTEALQRVNLTLLDINGQLEGMAT